jgi:hypothetical protein
MVKYHLYDERYLIEPTRVFPVEELDALVTDAERERNPFAGWKQTLLNAINEPPAAGMQYIIVRCGYITCTSGDGDRHLVLPEEYYLRNQAIAPAQKAKDGEYIEQVDRSRTCAYHYASISVRRKKETNYNIVRIKGVDVPYDKDDKTTTDWLDVTDYVAYHRNIDQITILSCTTRGCTSIRRHMHVHGYFIKIMKEAVMRYKHADWIEDA